MGRTIITKADIKRGRADATSSDDGYISKLQKYIPADVIAVYLTISTVLNSAGAMNWPLYWVLFCLILVATPFYLLRVAKITKKTQIIVSSISFIVWVFALGGPFLAPYPWLHWYNSVYGALLLPLYTFLIAIIDPQ